MNFKVRDTIVKPISIYVMNYFILSKRTFDMFFINNSMLPGITISSFYHHISMRNIFTSFPVRILFSNANSFSAFTHFFNSFFRSFNPKPRRFRPSSAWEIVSNTIRYYRTNRAFKMIRYFFDGKFINIHKGNVFFAIDEFFHGTIISRRATYTYT